MRESAFVFLSVNDAVMDNSRTASELKEYDIVWDEQQSHKFKDLSSHLQRIKEFKTPDAR